MTSQTSKYHDHVKWIIAIELASLLTACGGGGYGGGGGDAPKYTIGGTINTLHGTVVLTNNGGDNLTRTTDGAFTFATSLARGAAYAVAVQTAPASQTCAVTNGTGTVGATNIANVTVTCTDKGPVAPELLADPGVRSVTLSWTAPEGAQRFRIYVSSERNCDPANWSECAEGVRIDDATSPFNLTDLANGKALFFQLETLFANGTSLISPERGARPSALAFDGPVHSMARGTDGTVFVGGEFRSVGFGTGPIAALNLKSGRSAIPDTQILGGVLFATAFDGAGGFYAGGSQLKSADGGFLGALVHIDAKGQVDPAFHPDIRGAVRAIVVSPDRKRIYVGGDFDTVNGLPHQRIAALNDDGTLVQQWSADANSPAFALALDADKGVLYAGGLFDSVNGIARNRIVAVHAENGVVLSQWDAVLVGPNVAALQISGDTLYVAGGIKGVRGEERVNVAALRTTKIDAAGQASAAELLSWAPRIGDETRVVDAIAVDAELHAVYLGGDFETADPAPHVNLVAIGTPDHPDHAGAALPWIANAGGNVARGLVTALAVRDHVVYAAGYFDTVNGVSHPHLAAITPQGNEVSNWNPAPNDVVNSLAASEDTLIVAGEFNAMGSQPRAGLAALDSNDKLLDWNPGVSGGLGVKALTVAGDTLYVVGDFQKVGGKSHESIAAIGATGTGAVRDEWVVSANGSISAVAVANDVVYVTGPFTTATDGQGTKDRKGLAAFSTAGTLLDWAPTIVNGEGRALAVTQDRVVVGGNFTNVAGAGQSPQTRRGLAVMGAVASAGPLAEGQLAGWNAEILGGAVNTLDVGADGLIYFGGGFNRVFSQPRLGLAAISIDGVLSDAWQPQVEGEVKTLDVVDNTVYFGGDFEQVGAAPRGGLAAVDFNNVLLDWSPAGETGLDARALTVLGTRVFVGGFFTELGGVTQVGFGSVSATGAGAGAP